MRYLIFFLLSLFSFFVVSFDAVSAPTNFQTKGQAYQACMVELHRREAENPYHDAIKCTDAGGYYRCYAAAGLCYNSEDNIYFYNQSCHAQPATTITGSFSFPGPETFCYMGCEYYVTLGTVSYLAGNVSGEVCETDTPLGGDGGGGDDGDGGGQGEIDNPGDGGGGDDGGSTGGGSGTGGGDTGGGGDSGGGSAEVPGDSGGSGSGDGSGNNGGNGNGDGGGDGAGDGSGHDYSGVLDAILNKLTEIGDWLSGTDTGEADTEDDGIGPSSFWKNSESDDFKLDTSGFGYSRSCPKNPSFSFRGKTYTFDVSPICSLFIACGYVVVILASLWAVRVMVRD